MRILATLQPKLVLRLIAVRFIEACVTCPSSFECFKTRDDRTELSPKPATNLNLRLILLGEVGVGLSEVHRLFLLVVHILAVDGKLGLSLGGGSGGTLEPGALLLGAHGGGECEADRNDSSGDRHNRTVRLDDLAVGSADEVVLREVSVIGTCIKPSFLLVHHTYLKQKAASFETRLGVWKDPSRNEAAAYKAGQDHGASSSNPLRHVAPDRSADAGARLHQNRCSRRRSVVQLLSGEHEGRVRVLAAMRKPVEPAHQDDSEDASLPLLLKHTKERFAEVLGTGALGRVSGLDELLGLGPEEPEEADSKAESRSDPEHDRPGRNRAADSEVDASCQNVSKTVSLLEDTTEKTSCLGIDALERHAGCSAVHTAHAKSEDCTDGEELVEVLAGMEVEGVGGPGRKSDQIGTPAGHAKHAEQAEGVGGSLGLLPGDFLFTIFVDGDRTNLPVEEIGEVLHALCEDTLLGLSHGGIKWSNGADVDRTDGSHSYWPVRQTRGSAWGRDVPGEAFLSSRQVLAWLRKGIATRRTTECGAPQSDATLSYLSVDAPFSKVVSSETAKPHAPITVRRIGEFRNRLGWIVGMQPQHNQHVCDTVQGRSNELHLEAGHNVFIACTLFEMAVCPCIRMGCQELGCRDAPICTYASAVGLGGESTRARSDESLRHFSAMGGLRVEADNRDCRR
ncbi:hypothetical protein L1887_54192 [Cichorium endivia]|nr:hypothetical protein L1887_54192 [Cichorium endivia]